LPARPEDGSEPAWSATWSVAAAERVDMPHRNVMGLLRGTTKKDEYVVVSAHYDHVGIGSAVDGDAIYNGADDNATGTTGVLLLAEALAKLPAPARSVLFVCFTGEERGFLGSRAFCSRCPVPLERVVANFNLEMLGRPEDGKAGKAWITGSEYSDFAAIVAPALATGGVELMPFDMATRLFSASDNWAFVEKGIVAHSLSAGSLHKDYHGPNDEADALELTHMTQILRALVPAVLELANRAEPPRWNEQGESQVRRAKR
jgi:Zn-dependent M28 family amino/carboxypeptidase